MLQWRESSYKTLL